jgi:hypothetical protein
MKYCNLESFKPIRNRPFSEQSGRFLFAAALWGEARGTNLTAMQAVANVIINRAIQPHKWWAHQEYLPGDNQDTDAVLAACIKAVLLKPWQFSCFNLDDPNRAKMLEPWANDRALIWNQCQLIAAAAMDGWLEDNTEGADHYHSLPIIQMHRWPSWAMNGGLPRRPHAHIGPFRFYQLEG